jgi:hypothetical protein
MLRNFRKTPKCKIYLKSVKRLYRVTVAARFADTNGAPFATFRCGRANISLLNKIMNIRTSSGKIHKCYIANTVIDMIHTGGDSHWTGASCPT